jgi:hypothetical protein
MKAGRSTSRAGFAIELSGSGRDDNSSAGQGKQSLTFGEADDWLSAGPNSARNIFGIDFPAAANNLSFQLELSLACKKRFLSSNCSPWAHHAPLCHPERSGGICSFADQSQRSGPAQHGNSVSST